MIRDRFDLLNGNSAFHSGFSVRSADRFFWLDRRGDGGCVMGWLVVFGPTCSFNSEPEAGPPERML